MFTPPSPAPPPAAVAYRWGSLSLAGENNSFRRSITFDDMRRPHTSPSQPGAPKRWWLLHRVTSPNPSIRKEDWVDGRTCPGLDAAMRALAAAPAPRISDPTDVEAGRRTRVMLDGTDVTLDVPAAFALPDGAFTSARLRIETNDPGPLDVQLAQLQTATLGCWTAGKPAR